jgi:hypothetical protein
MNTLIEILIPLVNTVFDHTVMIFSSLSDCVVPYADSDSVTFVIAAGALTYIPESLHSVIRQWNGSIDKKFENIDNLVSVVLVNQQSWQMPENLLTQLCNNHNRLQTLINKCRSVTGSTADRTERNTLLKSTVTLCLIDVKIWAFGKYSDGVMTADDVHLLGFRLPGEAGGYHGRIEATNVIPEVKVKIINEDFIRVVIDRSAGENAARAAHGWPHRVKNAVIVITAADGKTEVCRLFTTRLYNDIHMPEGSHGKQFIIKAAFLSHVSDVPRFGAEQTFSMSLTTIDLVAAPRQASLSPQ